MSRIFANAANRGRISFESTNAEVMEMINTEVEQSIDRAFQILRTRVDRFGTSQPNIQRLQGTGRIQIELPGVDNPARVRKLLSGVAKLEFWEVHEIQEIGTTLSAINEELIKVETAAKEKVVLETQEADPEVVNPLEAQMAQTDTTASDSTSLETPGVSSFFALQQQGSENGFFYNLADTSRINRALKNDRIVRIIPQN